MSAQQIASLIPYIIVTLFLLAVILMVLALQQLRRGRRGPYWRLRRQASQRGGVLFLISIAMFVITFGIAFYSGLAAIAFRGIDDFFAGRSSGLAGVVVPTLTPTLEFTETATPTPTATATQTPTEVPTLTAAATATATLTDTPTATLTATPTATPTPTLTFTPSPTVDSVLQLTPPAPGIAARSSARINITAADEVVSSNQTPVEPRTVFNAGIERIYLFMSYSDMDDGVVWSRVLYRDGQPVQGRAYLWSLGEEGSSFFFFGNEAGYPPGDYEARLYLGDEETSRFEFVVEEAAGG